MGMDCRMEPKATVEGLKIARSRSSIKIWIVEHAKDDMKSINIYIHVYIHMYIYVCMYFK